MNNQKQLKKYANRFIERIKPSIRSGYDILAKIYPANSQGAILEFEIIQAKKSSVEIKPNADSINSSLKGIEQHLIGGNIDGVRFSGTNLYMEGNRILLIKGDDKHEEWSNAAVEDDIQRILSPRGGRS
jgi:hypothetical protein